MTLRQICRRVASALAFEPDVARAAAALSVFRIGLGSVLLCEALMTAPDLPLLVGEYGLMQRPINQALAPAALPALGWFRLAWHSGLMSEKQVTYVLLALYLISLVYLVAGWHTRLFAAAALFFHLLFKASGFASIYGAHELATNGLFFCLLLPVSARHLDEPAIRTGRVVLRAYLSIVYVSSGIEKIAGPAWRNGEAVWNFLMRPEVTAINAGWISQVPWLAVLLGWFVLTVEIGYCLCLFSVRARNLWFFGTLLLHAGIGLTLHLWVFSFTMLALNWGALGGAQYDWMLSALPRAKTVCWALRRARAIKKTKITEQSQSVTLTNLFKINS